MAIRFLLLSLLVSPLRAMLNQPRLPLVRRQLGLTALFYGLAHLTLYAASEKWALLHVVSEIALRFYLTIGFVALLGLAALGVTSTDGMVRRLGRRWRQLHRLAYPIAVLAVFHFFLQSKADVSEATLMAGIFLWSMGWRLLPAGADRAPLPVLGLGVAAAALTLAVEYAWFALGTRIDPLRPLRAELAWSFGPEAGGRVLILGCCMALATTLAWMAQRQRWRDGVAYAVARYAGGAAIVAALCYGFALTDAWLPETWSWWQAALPFMAGAALLGVGRWALPSAGLALDAAWIVCLVVPIGAGLLL